MFKGQRKIDYNYDNNGNLTTASNLSDSSLVFVYDNNNEIVKTLDANGHSNRYEYDNIYTGRILSTISESGINTLMKYDTFGNEISNRTIKRTVNEIINGLYRIRAKGTERYLRAINKAISMVEENCNHDIWNINLVDDYVTISHPLINNSYLTATSNQVILLPYDSTSSLFKLVRRDNGSYYFKVKQEEMEDENSSISKYIKFENSILVISELIENDPSFEFYIEDISNAEFIESNSEYTTDGRFLKSDTDSNLKKMNYDYDSMTGLLKKTINPKGQIVQYEYDDKRRLSKIIENDKTIYYSYNENNLISKIKDGEQEYNFLYNEFLKIEQVKIGNDVILVTNTYEENDGNLISSLYGNNNVVLYGYDEFNRIKTVTKMNDTYNYSYDSNGNLAKIESDADTIKYVYDLSQRLNEYQSNNFKVKYIYDECDKLIEKRYELNDVLTSVSNTLDIEDRLTKTNFDNNEINYYYDELGRLNIKSINKNFYTFYNYISNGNRSTLLVDSIINDGNIYKYKYDSVNNITHIYHNEMLENEYEYDQYNQLMREKNFIDNEIIDYKYDIYGNITNKKVVDLTNYNVKSSINYEYNNINWRDQLTKFDNKTITYDNIGNPLTIGNDILTWNNGKQLKSYNSNIYEYNIDDIRVSKTVNDIETKYYIEDGKIIFEKTNDNVIYYIRDSSNNLIGLKYNNDTYFYVKNIQKDIVGILDINCNLIAKYRYDSWGNLLALTDGSDNQITDSSHIGMINPFRYRGYYYDVETNLYYLNSRYYSPTLGRFLNTDNLLGANQDFSSNNLYAYCSNNPIVNVDHNGTFSLWDFFDVVFFVDSANKFIEKPSWGTFGNLALDTISLAPLIPSIGSVKKTTSAVSKVKKTKKAKTVAKKTTKKVSSNAKGKYFEDIVSAHIGVKKNTRKIEMGGRDRIPDFYNPKTNFLGEAKNVSYQSYTKQLRDYKKYADDNGLTMKLFMPEGSKTSKVLENSGINIVKYKIE